jgi:threonine dehydratase
MASAVDETLDIPLAAVREARARIRPYLIETPLLPWYGATLADQIDPGTRVWVKLELTQKTGSFKPRGALNVMQHLTAEERARGVTAVSAGNHAIAVAYAAAELGITAKVAMPRKASPFRVAQCRRFGAEVVLADDIAGAFAEGMRLRDEEGRVMVHPFEGPHTIAGTGTLGLEILEQCPEAEAVVVPIGGGGLIAGIANAIKQVRPEVAVLGVEPEGARGMSLSLAAGRPVERVEVNTIADSLGAPHHTAGTFSLIRQHVDEVVLVDDQAMIDAMALTFRDLKLAVEPAGACALAGLLGPLGARLAGRSVVLLVCGSNIDHASYCGLLARATSPAGGAAA